MRERINSEQLELEKLASEAVDLAVKKGADQVEVYIGKKTGLKVSCLKGQQENIEFNKSRCLEISVNRKCQTGVSTTTDFSLEAINKSIEAALNISSYTAADDCSNLPEKENLAWDKIDLDLFFPRESDPDEALEKAIELENASLGKDKRIKQSNGARYTSSYGISVLANSHGFVQSSLDSSYSLSIDLLAEQDGKMERNGSSSIALDFNKLWDADKIAKEAIEETVSMLGAKKLKTGSYPVIIRNDVAENFIGSLINSLGGTSQYRSTSFLQNSMGNQVTKDWFNIYLNPHILQGLGSSVTDGEGVATKAHNLIHNGVVESYLLSSYTARKLGMKTNGHCNYLGNVLVTDNRPQQYDYKQLLKYMDKGVLITGIMGQGLNQVTGNFSFGANGFYVEGGIIQYPINGITIAGNIRDLFENRLVALGTDLDERMSVKIGSVFVDEMKIAGI